MSSFRDHWADRTLKVIGVHEETAWGSFGDHRRSVRALGVRCGIFLAIDLGIHRYYPKINCRYSSKFGWESKKFVKPMRIEI